MTARSITIKNLNLLLNQQLKPLSKSSSQVVVTKPISSEIFKPKAHIIKPTAKAVV